MQPETFDLLFHRYILRQGHKPMRNACLLGKLDQVFPSLVLFDLARAGKQGFQIAIFINKERGCFDADTRDAGNIVSTVACE